MEDTKKIIIPSGSSKIRACVSERKFSYDYDQQLKTIKILYDQLCNRIDSDESANAALLHMTQHLQKKISGYKSQDTLKKLYNPDKFVKLEDVVKQLCDAQLECFYCKKQVYVLYEIVREVQQWTLDRIDNSMGHNRDNVMVACLECNLNRRTMYHERYAFTKTFTQVKKLDS